MPKEPSIFEKLIGTQEEPSVTTADVARAFAYRRLLADEDFRELLTLREESARSVLMTTSPTGATETEIRLRLALWQDACNVPIEMQREVLNVERLYKEQQAAKNTTTESQPD